MHSLARRERRRTASRGQTETIGVVLVLAMTLVGATVALGFGGTVLNDARVDSQEEGIQHAMTQLDSRSAMVALGDSATQYVRLGAASEGSYRVDPDAGWINITHSNYDGAGNDTVLYNETLGALVYENDDTVVAYQGGGVWRGQGSNSTMISPPEFHYQSSTLTFPVIRLEGDTSVGGASVTSKITSVQRAKRVYPDSGTIYPETGEPYQNPIRKGNITVTVHSAYHQAWATYFQTRTSGEVTVDAPNETVHVKLLSQGTYGDFDMPADGNSLELQGISEGHPFSNFIVHLRPDDTDSANFANLQWTMWAEQGNQHFEIHLRDGGQNGSLSTAYCTVRDVEATVYYSDGNGDPYVGWQDDTAFNTECDDLDGDGDNETYLEANLTGPSQLQLKSLSNSNLQHFNPNGNAKSSVVFDQHGPAVTWEDPPGKEFNTTGDDDTTMYNLTNHYIQLMGPDVELYVEDKGSNTVDEEASTGNVQHSSGGTSFITFLHITENRVDVELE